MTQQQNPQNQQTFPHSQPHGQGQQPYGHGQQLFVQAPQVPLRGTTDPRDMSLPLYTATFWQAIARFFRGYFKFSGRASIREFWWAQLGILIANAVPWLMMLPLYLNVLLYFVDAIFDYGPYYDPYHSTSAEYFFAFLALFFTPEFLIMGFISSLFGIALLLPTLALSWRRLQDANFHGAFSLLKFIPGGDLAVLIMAALPTKPEGQRFDKLPAGGGSQHSAPNYPAPGYPAPGGQASGYVGPQPAPQPPAAPQYMQPPVQQDPPQQQ